jgi:hypothetical protein
MKIMTENIQARSMTMNTQAMIDRLQSLNQDDLLDRVADALAHIDEVQTARDWIDSIHEADERLFEQVLDAISDSYERATGEWEDDDDGNMVMLLRCDWCENSDDFLDMDTKVSDNEYSCSICLRTLILNGGEEE